MTPTELEDASPKVFFALQRFLKTAELAAVRADYKRAHDAGGNTEQFLTREEGVSFNPRLARVLSILVKDLGVHDPLVLRAALYSAALDSAALDSAALCNGDAVSEHTPVSSDVVHALLGPAEQSLAEPNRELEALVLAVCAKDSDSRAQTIRCVLALDTVRHLHQSTRSLSQRSAVLHHAELLLREACSASIPQVLREKLEHACIQQKRLLRPEPGSTDETHGS
jgi:hypothetical protein